MMSINVVEILRLALDFTSNTVGKFKDEEYAKAVNEIYGHAPDYKELDSLAEMITISSDISTKEKNELLLAIADKRSELRDKEIEYKRECANLVNKGFENKCNIVFSAALFLFTGGLSMIPKVYHYFKSDDRDKLYIAPKSK